MIRVLRLLLLATHHLVEVEEKFLCLLQRDCLAVTSTYYVYVVLYQHVLDCLLDNNVFKMVLSIFRLRLFSVLVKSLPHFKDRNWLVHCIASHA